MLDEVLIRVNQINGASDRYVSDLRDFKVGVEAVVAEVTRLYDYDKDAEKYGALIHSLYQLLHNNEHLLTSSIEYTHAVNNMAVALAMRGRQS